MSHDQRTGQGYLLLADISGYTAFLVGTELEHATAIVHELVRPCDYFTNRFTPRGRRASAPALHRNLRIRPHRGRHDGPVPGIDSTIADCSRAFGS